jgi:hypothetical protein
VRSALLLASLASLPACACGDRTFLLVGTCPPGSPDRCGNACHEDFDCGAGLHCEDDLCTYDCTPDGDECASNRVCGDDGRCVDPPPDGGPPPPRDGGDDCPGIDLDLAPTVPTVVLLLDQSGSMDEDFGGIPRWDAMEQALVAPGSGVVATLEATVRFGATLYTSHNGDLDGESCPILQTVDPALDNHAAIQALLAANGPDGDTPTGDSIDDVAARIGGLDPALAPFYVVLATDGEPDSCEVPNPQTGQAEAIAAAEAAFAAGIRTFVLGVGSDVGAAHLQDMANAGAGLAVGGAENEPFFTANDPAELADAFGEIIGGVRTCVFTLSGEVDLDRTCEGDVVLNGERLECNGPDGWRLNDATTLELVGAACTTALTAAEVHLTAEFPCDAVII